MITTGIRLSPPVTPNGPTAQAWVLDELSKSKYAASRPNWFDDLATDLQHWFASLKGPAIGGAPGLGPVIIVAIVAIILVVAFLVFGLPRLNRRSRVTGDLFGEDDQRTAAQILAAARAAAASGDYTLAVIEGMRATARSLSERTLLTMFPGTTAHEFSRQAAVLFPDYRERLGATATTFDSVRYLNGQGTQAQWLETERLAIDLRTAPPVDELVDA